MAAFEDSSGPDLELFANQGWSAWHNAIEYKNEGISANGSESSSRHKKEVARLKRRDFGLFGFCPAKDNFYVVVCEHCNLPFKPQAFHYHIEKHHKGKSRLTTPPITNDDAFSWSSSQAYINESSFGRRSPATTEDSIDSSGSLGLEIGKKSSKIKRSNTSKHSIHHSESSSVVLSGSNLTSEGSNTDIYSMKWDKEAPRHSSKFNQALLVNKDTSNTAKQMQSSDAVHGSKNSSSGVHSKSAAKLHKRNFSLPIKGSKSRTDPFSNPSCNDWQHNINRHDSSSHHTTSKIVKKNHVRMYSENASLTSSSSSEPSTHLRKTSDTIFENGPVVLLEKSPLLDKSNPLVHASNSNDCDRVSNIADISSSANAISTSSATFRPYKHHHNPQFDIVKSADRGSDKQQKLNCSEKQHDAFSTKLLAKPKKNIPLKAREYDPNKHCGVWVSAENMHCTRSLTCKSHSRSIKRKVPGRIKPFDDLVIDHARAKQKLKKHSAQQLLPSSPLCSISGTLPITNSSVNSKRNLHSPAHDICEVTTSTVQNKISSSNVVKSHSQLANKTKLPIHLFPRQNPARHVDCWQDILTDDSLQKVPDSEQSYLNKHPSPLVLFQCGARRMGQNHVCFNRKMDFQWRSILTLLTDSTTKKKQKLDCAIPGVSCQTSLGFAPVPSVSSSVLTELKKAKVAAQQQKQQCSTELDSEFSNCKLKNCTSIKFINNGAAQHKQFSAQKVLDKSLSVDEGFLRKQSNSIKPARQRRNERHTVDSSGPPLPKSPRCSMPLDHRLTGSGNANLHHGKFVQLSAPTNFGTSSSSTTIDLTSYRLQGHNSLSLSSHSSDSPISNLVSSQHPNIILRGKTQKPKKQIKGRKNSLSGGGKHNSTLNNHHPAKHIMEDASSSSSTLLTKSDQIKQEIPYLNGMTSTALSSQSWPQTVTLSGTIGALMQTNSIASNSATLLKTVDLEQLNFSGGTNFSKQLSRNNNNSNSCGLDKLAENSASVDINGQAGTASCLESLLLNSNEPNSFSPGEQCLVDTASGNVFDVANSIQPTAATSVAMNRGQFAELTSEIISLLEQNGGNSNSDPTSSSHGLSTFTLHDDTMGFSNESANVAELSNT